MLQGFRPLQVTVRCANNAGTVRFLLCHGANPTEEDHAVQNFTTIIASIGQKLILLLMLALSPLCYEWA